MADLLAELGKMTGAQWVGCLAFVAALFVVGTGGWQTLVAGQAQAERDRRELAELEARMRERGVAL